MVSFFIALVALLIGYLLYGKFVEHLFGPDDRPTPAYSQADGVDYIPLPGWKVFMIQFLNIAGTGPIFGAIMGAQFGPSSYLWIVFGCIFAGAVHDYLCGMLSVRHNGVGVPELVGTYLGPVAKKIMLVFSVFLLLMVGTVFVYSPAIILGDKMGGDTQMVMIWCLIIFFYYIIATMLPIDKIIGRIYPLFAFSLMFMAVALCFVLIKDMPDIPEVWDGLDNLKPSAGPIFPCLFITIACGALSGFHATQSPLMARCMKHEKEGRPIFYGAMITEGVVALIWAAVSSYFFYGGAAEALGASLKSSAPQVVTLVSEGWLGTLGGILALNFALDFPQKVKTLVLIGTPYKVPKVAFSFQNIIFRFLPKSIFETMAFDKKNTFALGDTMKNLDFSDRVKNIKCPTLILCGKKDSANMKSADYLSQSIRSAELKIIENTGHVVNEENPKALADILNEYYLKNS